MIARPCIGCGDLLASGSYCHACRPANQQPRRGLGQASDDPVWRRLSLKARKQQPWCSNCNTDRDLTGDHLLPVCDYPELVHAIENIDVLCRSCNSRRGNRYTHQDAQTVLKRLEAAHKRRPTRSGGLRVDAAHRACQATRGVDPSQPPARPAASLSFPLSCVEVVR